VEANEVSLRYPPKKKEIIFFILVASPFFAFKKCALYHAVVCKKCSFVQMHRVHILCSQLCCIVYYRSCIVVEVQQMPQRRWPSPDPHYILLNNKIDVFPKKKTSTWRSGIDVFGFYAVSIRNNILSPRST